MRSARDQRVDLLPIQSRVRRPGVSEARRLRALEDENAKLGNTDHTVPLHTFGSNMPHAELEIRQDLIAGTEGQRMWTERLALILAAIHQRFSLA